MAFDANDVIGEIMAGMELEKDEIRAQLHEHTVEIRDDGRSMAPVYHGPPHGEVVPGGFRDSIVDEPAPDHDNMPAERVISRSRIAYLLEFGTKHMHEFGTFGALAAKYGGTVDLVEREE